ncbi:MAG: hypothetical protein IT364_00930 [Candidatus Hydrogenedentes bacterium]|nr:hypothetical protein [Candidatus Hydrogenedentota bacterium]
MTGAITRRLLPVLAAALTCFLPVSSAEVIDDPPLRITYAPDQQALARESHDILTRGLEDFGDRLPPGDQPIEVIICSTLSEFAKHAGSLAQSNVLGIAKPDEGLIAIKAPNLTMTGSDYRGTLRHELVHVLLARHTSSDNLPRWLNEGVAMILSGEYRWESRARVAQMYWQGRLIPYRDLLFAFLEPGKEMEFGDAYAQALSMTRYLKDEAGEETFWRVIHDMDSMTFGDALRAEAGLSPAEFYEDWTSSLWTVALVFSLVSGFSIFQVMAILTVIAYFRKRRRGLATVREWEEQEQNAEDEDVSDPLPWNDPDEDEDLWEEERN